MVLVFSWFQLLFAKAFCNKTTTLPLPSTRSKCATSSVLATQNAAHFVGESLDRAKDSTLHRRRICRGNFRNIPSAKTLCTGLGGTFCAARTKFAPLGRKRAASFRLCSIYTPTIPLFALFCRCRRTLTPNPAKQPAKHWVLGRFCTYLHFLHHLHDVFWGNMHW